MSGREEIVWGLDAIEAREELLREIKDNLRAWAVARADQEGRSRVSVDDVHQTLAPAVAFVLRRHGLAE